MYFYDKHVYFFHNKCAGSSEPQWGHNYFSETKSIRTYILINFYGQNNYQEKKKKQKKTVWRNQIETKAPVIFVTAKVALVSTFKLS